MPHDNSNRFLNAFARIEGHLRRIAKVSEDNRRPFSVLVKDTAASNATIKRFADDLREFAELRNAIVHDGGPYPIAEPHQKTVQRLEEIEQRISQPPLVESLDFVKVITCSPSDAIGKAAMEMFKGAFSQLPVYEQKRCVGLLTSETVARWIANQLQPGLCILGEEPVEQVLSFQEKDSVYEFASRKRPIADVIALFDKIAQSGQSLDAVLITHSGEQDQTPLHILTVYDLPQLYQRMKLSADESGHLAIRP